MTNPSHKLGDTPHSRTLLLHRAGQTWNLSAASTLLGSAPDCAIRLKGAGVSARHAEIASDDADWVITDLGTVNGTCVNGRPILKHALRHGDQILVGTEVLSFVREGSVPSGRSSNRTHLAYPHPACRPTGSDPARTVPTAPAQEETAVLPREAAEAQTARPCRSITLTFAASDLPWLREVRADFESALRGRAFYYQDRVAFQSMLGCVTSISPDGPARIDADTAMRIGEAQDSVLLLCPACAAALQKVQASCLRCGRPLAVVIV